MLQFRILCAREERRETAPVRGTNAPAATGRRSPGALKPGDAPQRHWGRRFGQSSIAICYSHANLRDRRNFPRFVDRTHQAYRQLLAKCASAR